MMQNHVQQSFCIAIRIILTLSTVCILGFLACDECKWQPWGSWREECHCGVYGEIRNRTRSGTCTDSDSIYNCRYIDYDMCDPCKHQGQYNAFTKQCQCPERLFGECCEKSKYCFILLYAYSCQQDQPYHLHYINRL